MAENENSTSNTSEIFIEEDRLRAVVIALLAVGIAATIPATYVRWTRKRLREVECAFLLNALAFYIAYEAVLLSVMPIVYKMSYLGLGQMKPWPTVLDDTRKFITLMFVSSLLSWTVLWSVKLSLLVFYRRLMTRLPRYLMMWNIVLGYTLVAYIYTMVTTFTSCGGPVNFNRHPELFCARKGDGLTRNLSFYGAFASDLTTDILIILLPMGLLWKLQLSTQRKMAVGGMFSIGILVIIAAVVRLVQIDSKTGSLNPNSQWLTLWGSVEATTAIIVGCLPTFRFFRKTSSSTNQRNYYSNSGWHSSRKANISIPLPSYAGTTNSRHVATVYGGEDVSSSKESLAPKNGVLVTTRHQVESHLSF